MRSLLSLLALCVFATLAHAASPGAIDARMNSFFKFWETDETVTRARIAELYAPRVEYYGRSLDREGVYAAKQVLVHLWPTRHYTVLPGSVSHTCTAGRCHVDLVLTWDVIDATGQSGTRGSTTVSLNLVEVDGSLKIARETGSPLTRLTCKNPGDGWTCTAFQTP